MKMTSYHPLIYGMIRRFHKTSLIIRKHTISYLCNSLLPPFYVANQIISLFFVLFSCFYALLYIILHMFCHRASVLTLFVASGKLHKQQESRIKLLSDVVSRSHSSGYFFRSWSIMPQPCKRCSLIDSSGRKSGHCDMRSPSGLYSRRYMLL